MKVLETARLMLRWLETDDAAFILQLVNEPSWLRFIGDKGIRTVEDATFGLSRLLAITSQDNEPSARLLEKLGFHFERLTRLAPDAAEVKVFATT